jgi:hypothetical protein
MPEKRQDAGANAEIRLFAASDADVRPKLKPSAVRRHGLTLSFRLDVFAVGDAYWIVIN